jgi:periplasmic protein TonB
MSIMLRLLTLKVLPVAASLLLHVAAYGAMLMAPGLIYPRESIILAELVQPDPEPPAPPKRPEPPKPDRRPLTLPKPIETPMPKPVDKPLETAKVEPPPPPEPVAPTPGPVSEPVAPTGRGPLAPIDAPITTSGDGLPTQPGPPAPAQPATPSVAALPPDGITQTAAPRGGYQVRPSYPTSARRAGIQGTTLLGVFVAADGRVGEVVVKQSAGHPDLDAAAADAVKRWRFEPARRGSESVAMWVLLPVEFRLR